MGLALKKYNVFYNLLDEQMVKKSLFERKNYQWQIGFDVYQRIKETIDYYAYPYNKDMNKFMDIDIKVHAPSCHPRDIWLVEKDCNAIKNCLNCRFGTNNKLYCPYVTECAITDRTSAPSHWREFTDAQKLEREISYKISGKKLLGDISGGYHYLDTDLAAIEESKRRAKEMDILQSYYEHDKKCIGELINSFYGTELFKKEEKNMSTKLDAMLCGTGSLFIQAKVPEIKNVIFSGHCTIVLWSDGDKTIVRCGEYEFFDKEKGLAMAICKKMLGTNKSKSNYNDIFKKWCKDE